MKVKIVDTGEIKTVSKIKKQDGGYFVWVLKGKRFYWLGVNCYLINQTKGKSLLEAIINTVVGLLTSFVLQLILYPLLNIEVSLNQNIIITVVFFTVSIIRGYLIRRFFNKR